MVLCLLLPRAAHAVLEGVGAGVAAQLPGLQFPAVAHPEGCFGWSTRFASGHAGFSASTARLFSLPELEGRNLAFSLPLGSWETVAGLRDFGFSAWRERSLVLAGSRELGAGSRFRVGLGGHALWVEEVLERRILLVDGVLSLPVSPLTLHLGVRTPTAGDPWVGTRQLQRLEGRLSNGWVLSVERQGETGRAQQHTVRIEWLWKEQRFSLAWLGDAGWTGAFWCKTPAGSVLVSCWWHPWLPVSPAVGYYY